MRWFALRVSYWSTLRHHTQPYYRTSAIVAVHRVFGRTPYSDPATRHIIFTRELTCFAVFSIWLFNVSLLSKAILRYFGIKLWPTRTLLSSTSSSLLACLFFKLKAHTSVLFESGLSYHLQKYLLNYFWSSFKVSSPWVKFLDWYSIAIEFGNWIFVPLVFGRSLIYKLNKVGASTDPWGSPSFVLRHRLPLIPMMTWNCRFDIVLSVIRNKILSITGLKKRTNFRIAAS